MPYSTMRISMVLLLLCLLSACDDSAGTPAQVPAQVPAPLGAGTVGAGTAAATAALQPVAATPSAVDSPAALPAPGGAIVASVYRNWDWDIYALSPSGSLLRRLTFGDGDNRAPAWSPDGQRIAFESNRNRNWDVYSMRADGSDVRRLTDDPHFDGSPRWSPDGQRIAFSSDRAGGLDIWVMSAADGSQLTNLTLNSPSPDYDPAWSPDGKQLAYTSLREGTKAVFVMNADGSNIRRLTPASVGEADQPTWSPDGAHIAFVAEQNGAREIYQANSAGPLNLVRVTALEYYQWPAWMPDGSGLIFVAQSEKGQVLQSVQPGRPAQAITSGTLLYRQPDWSARSRVELDLPSLQQTDEPLYLEKTTPNPPDHPDRYNMVRLNGVRVIVPALSDTVDDSFFAARQRVAQETGWDFMAQLSEAMRPLAFKSPASDYLSWHKAGRAIDLLFTFPTSQGQALEIAREDELGDTYWRLYLRAANQDGSQGEPLRQAVWDLGAEARLRSKGQGGLVKGMLPGYYVDLSELLRQYGWRRIASHTEPAFDWHRDYAAIEFWHYQKTDGLSWWQGIQEIYPPKDLGDMFSYQNLVRAHYDISTLIQKGVPVPADVMLRYSAIQP
jgi:TolB protein